MAQPRTRLVEMQATACYTSVLKFMSPTGRVCGAATHAVGGDADYGLLPAVGENTCYGLLEQNVG